MSQNTSLNLDFNTSLENCLTSVSIKGFKSFYEECRLDIRPLTILAGANSSGKSSIIHPLLLMKQTIEANYDPGILLIDGANINFNRAEEFLSNYTKAEGAYQCQIKLETEREGIAIELTKAPDELIQIKRITHQEGEKNISFFPKMTKDEVILSLKEYAQKLESVWKEIITLERSRIFEQLEWNLCQRRCFLDLVCKAQPHVYNSIAKKPYPMETILYDSRDRTEFFAAQIRQLIHVPAKRANSQRYYPITAIVNQFPGTFENYTASVIQSWQIKEDDRYNHLLKYLDKMGFSTPLKTSYADDTKIKLEIGSGLEPEWLNIMDSGSGLQWVLPILVALLSAEPGRLVYLEHPELLLHPRNQLILSNAIIEAAKRGVRVIVETHNPLLILNVQTLVADGEFSREMIKLHWFERNQEGGTTILQSDLDEAGSYGDWPVDLGITYQQLSGRYQRSS